MAANVTGLLQAWSGGDAEALEQLVPLVQRELREMARRMLSGERLAMRLLSRSFEHGWRQLGASGLLNVPLIGSGHWGTQYDLSPDGQRVYFVDQAPPPRPSVINLAHGWKAFLR